MTIYLYGIVQPTDGMATDTFPADVSGVTGQVSVDRTGDLTLIYGTHDGSDILPRRRALLAHARVLEAATDKGTVLPMRFGMTCASLDDFRALARDAAPKIDAALARVRGCVEIGVRVQAPEEAALAAALAQSPALSRQRDRLAQTGAGSHFDKVGFGRALGDAVATRRRAAQKQLLAGLRPFVADHVLKAPETDFEVLRAECLIAEDRLPEVTAWLEEAVAGLDFAAPTPCTAQIVGPGPAFHFVDLALDAPPAASVA